MGIILPVYHTLVTNEPYIYKLSSFVRYFVLFPTMFYYDRRYHMPLSVELLCQDQMYLGLFSASVHVIGEHTMIITVTRYAVVSSGHVGCDCWP